MADLPILRIFLSSSSDVKAERRIVSRTIAELAHRHQRYLTIELIDWESDFYSADRDFQGQIPNAADSDLVVCIFHRRVGSELDPASYKRDENSYLKPHHVTMKAVRFTNLSALLNAECVMVRPISMCSARAHRWYTPKALTLTNNAGNTSCFRLF